MIFNRTIRAILVLVLIGMNISCDQITKKEVRERISERQIIEVVNSNFILTKVENTGAALSLGANLSPILKFILLKVVPILMMLALLGYTLLNSKLPKLQVLAFTFIIGGGIGNLIDRVRFNSVTDFMYLEVGPLHTGVFNMADLAVSTGVVLLILSTLFHKEEKELEAAN